MQSSTDIKESDSVLGMLNFLAKYIYNLSQKNKELQDM